MKQIHNKQNNGEGQRQRQQQTKECDALVKPRFRPCHICDRKYTDMGREIERKGGVESEEESETEEPGKEWHRKPGVQWAECGSAHFMR